jgi:multiple sugar transport system permease protein
MERLSDRGYVLLLVAPASLFLLLFVVIPVINLIGNSFFDVSLLNPGAGTFVGLKNYLDAFNSSKVIDSAWITAKYTVLTVTLELLLGFGVALAFDALGRRSEFLRTAFLFPLMIPPLVAGLLWRFLLIDNFGVINWMLAGIGLLKNPNDLAWLSSTRLSLTAVILPDVWLTTCFVAMVLYAGLQNIPEDIKEAAKIDGASALQLLWRIIVPMLRPVIAVVLILRGIDAARTFDIIWLMTEGGPRASTNVLSLEIFREMVRYGQLGQASAIAVLFLLLLLTCSLIAFFTIWNPRSR